MPDRTQGRIHRLRDGGELVCRVQTDLGLETPYILCAPVVPRADWGALVPKLHIPVALDGVPHVILMSQMLALPGGEIGAAVGDASALRDEIIAAVDLLVSGF
ncbi:MAG: CcdB family protein [Roseovarius sp.]|nr:CcdB family protein [Roseovarius sp.]